MATVTVRLRDEKHQRLKLMAKRYGIGLTILDGLDAAAAMSPQ